VRAFHTQIGVLVEQVKEFALGGHQTSKHGFLRKSELILLGAAVRGGGLLILLIDAAY
jgi:hypothetical protein